MLDAAKTKCDEIVNKMTEKFSEATDENRQIIQKYADNKIASYFSYLHKEIAQFQMSPLSGQERTEYEVTFAKLNSYYEKWETFKDDIYSYK